MDYCLKVGEKKAVFLEVKRLIEDLEKYEKQLLEYSFADGVDIAVLTNGLLWWFYLALGTGDWKQRKFFTIDIKQQEPIIAAKHFREFLGHESISNGNSLKHARSLQASRETDQLIKQTIPEAWEQLIVEPDELLLELLAEKVENMCGHPPELQMIANFIQAVYVDQRKPSLTKPSISQIKNQQPTKTSTPTNMLHNRSPRQRGISVTIDGRKFSAMSVSDLYDQVLKYLYENKLIEKLKPYLPYATSRKRYLISIEPVHPQGNQFVVPIEYKGYYMEAHKSYHTAITCLTDLLGLIGLSLHQ